MDCPPTVVDCVPGACILILSLVHQPRISAPARGERSEGRGDMTDTVFICDLGEEESGTLLMLEDGQ